MTNGRSLDLPSGEAGAGVCNPSEVSHGSSFRSSTSSSSTLCLWGRCAPSRRAARHRIGRRLVRRCSPGRRLCGMRAMTSEPGGQRCREGGRLHGLCDDVAVGADRGPLRGAGRWRCPVRGEEHACVRECQSQVHPERASRPGVTLRKKEVHVVGIQSMVDSRKQTTMIAIWPSCACIPPCTSSRTAMVRSR